VNYWNDRADRDPVRAGKVDGLALPLFPVRSLVPGSACPHHGPIPEGSNLVCMVCYQSGRDGHPSLKETAADKIRLKGWEPEGGKDQWGHATEATAYEAPKAAEKATRKQRRAANRQTPTA